MAKTYFGGFWSNEVNFNESDSFVASIVNLELRNHLIILLKTGKEPRKHVSIFPVAGNCRCTLAASSPVNKDGFPERVPTMCAVASLITVVTRHRPTKFRAISIVW